MSELCQAWEQTALKFTQQNTKIIRLGVVFGDGGILPQMLLPIRLNMVAKIGSGRNLLFGFIFKDVLRTIIFYFNYRSIKSLQFSCSRTNQSTRFC